MGHVFVKGRKWEEAEGREKCLYNYLDLLHKVTRNIICGMQENNYNKEEPKNKKIAVIKCGKISQQEEIG